MRAVVDENEPAAEEDIDWEQLNEKERDELISSSLKKLGNVKEKRMSVFILKDMLGVTVSFHSEAPSSRT